MTTRFPEWIRRKWASGAGFDATKGAIDALKLHTVCQSAHCPNQGECWQHRTATLMVLGNTCTRNCAFCSVASSKRGETDPNEPQHVAEAVKAMELRHAVITTVMRDDLTDGGAGHIAETVRAIRAMNPRTTIEVLVSDFNGDAEAVETVLQAAPEVFGHNIETVERLYPHLRDRRFHYKTALAVLQMASRSSVPTIVKSAMMVGHGETGEEVRETLADLLDARVEAVCLGQYLRPTRRQREVAEFIHPDQFKRYEEMAYAMGFQFVQSGPFVRSSYRSELLMQTGFAREKLQLVGRT